MRRAGFVLVGGLSSRMGRDKALLRWHSEPLVEEVAKTVEQAAGNVALVGAPERYGMLSRRCLPDLHPGMGPLSGIEAALLSGRGDLNLVVACDMPALDAEWLAKLFEKAESSDSGCVAARDERGQIHPLCAVYRSACLGDIRAAIARNRLRMHDLLSDVGAVAFDFASKIPNVNTPDEWAQWKLVQQARQH